MKLVKTSDLIQRRLNIFSARGRYRFRLEHRWGEGPAVLCIMMNPSLAGSVKETDMTTEKCKRIWNHHGFAAHVAMNLWPFINPDPRIMKDHISNLSERSRARLIELNDGFILEEAGNVAKVVIAWGAEFHDPRGLEVARKLNLAGHDLWCLGTNNDLSPRHPLARGNNRVPADAQLLKWIRLT